MYYDSCLTRSDLYINTQKETTCMGLYEHDNIITIRWEVWQTFAEEGFTSSSLPLDSSLKTGSAGLTASCFFAACRGKVSSSLSLEICFVFLCLTGLISSSLSGLWHVLFIGAVVFALCFCFKVPSSSSSTSPTIKSSSEPNLFCFCWATGADFWIVFPALLAIGILQNYINYL